MSSIKVANVHFVTDGSVRAEVTSNNVIRLKSNAALQIASGTLADRPPIEDGLLRYNTENFNNEIAQLNVWSIIATNADIGVVFAKANIATTTAISAFAQANNVTAAFLKANTAGTDAINAFNQANNVTAAFLQANTAGTNAINAFDRANTANAIVVGNTLSNNMFQIRTSSRTRLNLIPGTSIIINVDDDSAQDRANVTITAPDVVAAFAQANNVTAAFLKANTAGTDATNAFGQANNVTAAFLQANTAGTNAINAFNRANTANAIVVGNTLSNNMFQLRSTSRTRLNLIPGTSILINVDDDSAQDRANVTITAPDVVAAFAQANNVTAAFLKANTAGTDATNAFGQANNVTAAFLKANTAAIDANSAFSRANTSVQNNLTTLITVGYNVQTFNAGSNLASYSTWVPNPSNGNYQFANTNGALTIAVPPANCAIDILIINGPTTGAITFSGYTVGSTTGDTYATTAVNKYILSIRRLASWSTYVWKALQ